MDQSSEACFWYSPSSARTVGYLWIRRTAQATLPDAAIDVWFTARPAPRKRAEQGSPH
ncbi:MAG: hypothetical protein ACLU3I_11205 [Acutalibacteraceae bacterium]